MITSAFVGAAFMVADGTGLLEYLFNWKPNKAWVYVGVFALFAIVVLVRLVKLQATVDEVRGDIILKAIPTVFITNQDLPDEPPLEKDEISLYTTIKFEVWTNVDLNTSKLVLNLVAFRNVFDASRWDIFKPPQVKPIVGIPIVDNSESAYRKRIRCSDEQPFTDTVTFKWREKANRKFAGRFYPQLALEMGIPKRILRVYLDDPLAKKGKVIIPL
ncbi:MAG: hypothetical protein FJ005_09535 [Chloroflexi bacterium]|nr:hypothetical protein [Chloroflexota bacterium]